MTGLLCHLDDACISNPCHKGALCDTNPLNGQYICTCPQGYKGADCTEDVDECAMGEYVEPFLFLMVSVELSKHSNRSKTSDLSCYMSTVYEFSV